METLAVYIEVAKEHRDAIESARYLVVHPPFNTELEKLAKALVAIDEAMFEQSEGFAP